MASAGGSSHYFCYGRVAVRGRAAVTVGEPGSCRLKVLWTVNLGAGLGAVSGANKVPHSPPEEPANPEHAPITTRWQSRQELQGKLWRPRPTTLRRTDIPSAASRF
jgi:hypothetical protein